MLTGQALLFSEARFLPAATVTLVLFSVDRFCDRDSVANRARTSHKPSQIWVEIKTKVEFEDGRGPSKGDGSREVGSGPIWLKQLVWSHRKMVSSFLFCQRKLGPNMLNYLQQTDINTPVLHIKAMRRLFYSSVLRLQNRLVRTSMTTII